MDPDVVVPVCCKTGSWNLELLNYILEIDEITSKPLYHAVAANHSECLKTLLEDRSIDVNDKTKNGTTVLFVACYLGLKEIVSMLLKHGANPDLFSSHNRPLMFEGASSTSLSCIELLLNENMDVNGTVGNGSTLLHQPLILKDANIVSLFISKKADIFVRNNDGETPFAIAARLGCVDVLKMFLTAEKQRTGCQSSSLVNVTNERGVSPLMFAATGNHSQCVELLLENGADTSFTSWTKESAAHEAALHQNLRMLEMILSRTSVEDLEYPPPNRTKTEYSILHLVAERGRFKAIEMLVHHGLNIELEIGPEMYQGDYITLVTDSHISPENYTPLGIACYAGIIESVDMLLKLGATPNSPSPTVVQPLVAACMGGDVDIVKLLLKNGAFIKNGKLGTVTPVVSAVLWSHNCIRVLEIVLRAGADVEYLGEGRNLENLKSMFDKRLWREGSWLDIVGTCTSAFQKYMQWETWNKYWNQILGLPAAYLQQLERYANRNPLTLQGLSRNKIRRILMHNHQTNLLKTVPELPIPASLHKYLLFED